MGPPLAVRRALVGAALVVATVAASAPSASAAVPVATVLNASVSSPKGITLDRNDQPLVSQGAFGPPGPVVRLRTQPPNVGGLEPLSPTIGATGVAWVRKNQSTWILGSDGTLYRQKRFGEAPYAVRDLVALSASNPDPGDTEGNPGESNPFGLVAKSDGSALVTDAAANSLVRVTPSGKTQIIARFPTEVVSTDHLGDPNLPPTIEAESVPTGVAIGPNGHIFVAELKGFPFRPGSSRIWTIEPSAGRAVCSLDPRIRRRCRVAYEGFDSIASITFDQQGALWVFQYAAGGVGVFEEGCFGPAGCPPAVLLKVTGPNGSSRVEVAPGELQEPGWMVSRGNTLYLTDHVLSGGRVLTVPTG